MRVLLILLLAAVSLGATTPASTVPDGVDPSAAAPSAGPHRVGVLFWSMQIPGQVAMREGLERRAAELSAAALVEGARPIELVTRVAGNGSVGIERQIAQFDELIGLGLDLIIVQPTDNAALAKGLLRANEAGIPVIAYDQHISGKGKLTSFVTSDNRQAGALGGEYLAAEFPNDRTLRLVLVEYPHVSSTVERVDGFMDALRAASQPFEVIGSYDAVEPVAGAAAGAAILRDFPEKGSIDAIFTVNDGGGLAVVDALAAAGRTEIAVATVDGDAASVRNIVAGRLTRIDAAQFCGALGAESMNAAWEVLHGREVAAHILVPTFPITQATHELFKGWNQPPPEPFTKPWPSPEPTWAWTLRRGE